jgi:hypothetical protein
MATSERMFHLQHVLNQPLSISFVCPIGVHIAVTPSMEPRS